MDSQIEAIKSALDIVTVVQSYVPSLKARGRNHFGLCPFHQEKSPSFSVNPELQIFKCFGCGEGGDVLSFLQKIEGLDFPAVLELAAAKAGISLEKFSSPQEQALRREKARAYEAHRLACEYYHYLLLSHPSGKPGLEYAINRRKLRPQQLKQYKLGFAPRAYHNLEKFLLKKGFNQAELVKFGLLVNKDGRIYDKFRERLLHPIANMQGEVVGFSGRIINPEHPGPKYLNSPETIIYHKKDLLYGAYQAKDEMRRRGFVILVEGNLDVVSSAKVGMGNIVCPLGTALTPEQLRLVKRYVRAVYFAFDTDAAGKKALLRSLELTEQAGLIAKAIDLGEYKDVDEMVVAKPELWLARVETALEIPEYVVNIFKADYDLSSASDKIAYLDKVLPFIAKLRQQIKIDHYLQQLELITGTKYEILQAALADKQRNIAHTTAHSQPEQTPTAYPAQVEVRVNKALKQLLVYLYAYKEQLTDPEKLLAIYRGRLTKNESALLDLCLGVIANNAPAELYKQQLAQIVSEQTVKIDLDFEEPQAELSKMLKAYVKNRVQTYLRTLKQKLLQSEQPDSYNRRILEYTKVLQELSW